MAIRDTHVIPTSQWCVEWTSDKGLVFGVGQILGCDYTSDLSNGDIYLNSYGGVRSSWYHRLLDVPLINPSRAERCRVPLRSFCSATSLIILAKFGKGIVPVPIANDSNPASASRPSTFSCLPCLVA